jgi:hypothetical protein
MEQCHRVASEAEAGEHEKSSGSPSVDKVPQHIALKVCERVGLLKVSSGYHHTYNYTA